MVERNVVKGERKGHRWLDQAGLESYIDPDY
jgi:hypothetical protein